MVTVISWKASNHRRFVGKCSYCDKVGEFWKSNYRSGRLDSCGCNRVNKISQNRRRHGCSSRKVYLIWRDMIARCSLNTHHAYASYGGRGIAVCERWLTFENFYADMGDRPPGRSLDRIENDKGYSPENCRWATKMEQMYNRRVTRYYDWRGRMATLLEIERESGVPRKLIRLRLWQGWDLERAATQKPRVAHK